MALKLKVRDGTPPFDGAHLCGSCRWDHHRQSRRGEHTYYCRLLERPTTSQVTFCNKYENAAAPTVRDMEKVAWILGTKSKGSPIGFHTAKDWRSFNKDDDIGWEYD